MYIWETTNSSNLKSNTVNKKSQHTKKLITLSVKVFMMLPNLSKCLPYGYPFLGAVEHYLIYKAPSQFTILHNNTLKLPVLLIKNDEFSTSKLLYNM